MFLSLIATIPSHQVNTDTHEQDDQRPEVGHGFPMVSNILKKQDQPNPTDDATGDGKGRGSLATCEHCHEKERAESDNGEGPQEAPIHHTEKLACQSHKAEDDEKCARDQCAGIRTVCLHFILLSHFEKLFLYQALAARAVKRRRELIDEDLLFFTQK